MREKNAPGKSFERKEGEEREDYAPVYCGKKKKREGRRRRPRPSSCWGKSERQARKKRGSSTEKKATSRKSWGGEIIAGGKGKGEERSGG